MFVVEELSLEIFAHFSAISNILAFWGPLFVIIAEIFVRHSTQFIKFQVCRIKVFYHGDMVTRNSMVLVCNKEKIVFCWMPAQYIIHRLWAKVFYRIYSMGFADIRTFSATQLIYQNILLIFFSFFLFTKWKCVARVVLFWHILRVFTIASTKLS